MSLLKALERAQREVARLEAMVLARKNPAHEHHWYVLDDARHCFQCGTTETAPFVDVGVSRGETT